MGAGKRMSEMSEKNILKYEGDIWSIADLFFSVGIKQSDYPAFMMPFFALMMLEGRMRNAVNELRKEYGIEGEELPEGFGEVFLTKKCGFNKFIVLENKTLADICRNDTSFEQDFAEYLRAFDPEIRQLLGIDRGKDERKYLDIDKYAAELKSKGILMQVVSKWSAIDLSDFDNSDITTLEEHIKRKWADISASTAGEQYTPDDIISLISEIVALKTDKPKDKIVHVYDPTCGGANMLFGVADRLGLQGRKLVATYGSEWNDALYALAAIESRFRDFSTIKYGNTLTNVPFADQRFDAIVANPPYGVSWKGYQKEVQNDQRGQFEGGEPATSDGQLLFLQHILWQLDTNGIAVVVHNGSTLFSGDAGSGESNIRKYIFDHDWVEALIQMPQKEFFNTGITTYLWVLNKNKSPERRNRVALIDGSNLWVTLKKNKGEKSREMSELNRAEIIEELRDFKDSKICKIFNREHFYYNKQKVFLTEVDEDGKYIEKTIKIDDVESILTVDGMIENVQNITSDEGKALIAKLKESDWKTFVIETGSHLRYEYDQECESVIGPDGKKLGRGKFSFALKKGLDKGTKSLQLVIEREVVSDYEIIPHRFDSAENDKEIDAFIKKYIFKPFEKSDNVVGVEINFNKEFFVLEKLQSVEDILKEIADIDSQLKGVEL